MAALRVLAPGGRVRPAAVRGLAAVLLATFAICLLAAPSLAYDNIGAHPKINSEAVLQYLERAKGDEWLAGTSLDGLKVSGYAVTELGLLSRKDELQEMAVADWLAHGGMSADEPELPASFRHFYDPARLAGVSYLTDHIDDLIGFGLGLGGQAAKGVGHVIGLPDRENPKTDAREWAFTHPGNQYSFAKALDYFALGLSEPAELNQAGKPVRTSGEYGRAWRAVGETMHLMADMTVPAHVRNDSHPYLAVSVLKLGNPDPFESTTRAAEVARYAGGAPSPSIDYGAADLAALFDDVARWTNANFYSGDTIQKPGRDFTENGQPPYPSPALGEASNGYYKGQVDGHGVLLAKVSLMVEFGLLDISTPAPYSGGFVDWAVVENQRSLLIPTAIAASSRVIDHFLPRFESQFSVEQASTTAFKVKGNLAHHATGAWPDAPEVRNGAFLRFRPKGGGAEQVIWLPMAAYKPGSRVEYEWQAEAGGTVSLEWDLGGYVIASAPKTLGGAAVKPEVKSLGTLYGGEDVTFGAEVSGAASSLRTVDLQWQFGDGKPPQTYTVSLAAGEVKDEAKHVFDLPGEYQVTVKALHPQSGEELASGTCKVSISERKVQIYPNVISGDPGVPVEASCLPSDERLRYEWSFGDGQTQKYGKSVVQHTYDKGGTYSLKVKLFLSSADNAQPVAEDTVTVEIAEGGACPRCGATHGEYALKTESKRVYYADSKGIRQCLCTTYFDEAKTKVMDQGCYLDGNKNGLWVSYTETGVKQREDPYVAGARHGIYRTYDSKTGALREETEYRNGVHEGSHVEWQTVTFGPMTGQTVKRREGQQVYSEASGGPVRQGFWTEWFADGSKQYEGAYAAGLREGPWREYVQGNGVVAAEGEYHLGKRIDKWILRGGDMTAEGNYVEGFKQGVWMERYSGGGWETGSFVDDAKKGLWTIYLPDGKVWMTKTY